MMGHFQIAAGASVPPANRWNKVMAAAFFSSVLALVTSWVITGWLMRTRGSFQVLDHPNHRSLHVAAIPRSGGLAIMSGIILGVLACWNDEIKALLGLPELCAFSLLLLVSFLDDLFQISALVRLLLMMLVSIWILVDNAVFSSSGYLVGALAFLFLLWSINVYNFMDGMDGLAGGMTVIGYGVFSLLAWNADATALAGLCWIVMAAVAGFLRFNFPPARIFMGDAGAVPLGFLTALLILYSHANNILPIWLGILVFSPFFIDATLTLLRRMVQGERFWEAHRSHFYQRLVQLGWSQRRTVLYEYALMLACGLSALGAASLPALQQVLIIGAWILVYGFLVLLIHRMESQ